MNSPAYEMPRGAWAAGDLLIVSPQAVLPPFCIKCGRPAELETLRKTFSWHPRWVYILILTGLLIYIIVALVLRKSITLQIPLCSTHRERYRALRIAGAVLMLGSILEMIVGFSALPDSYAGLILICGFSALISGLVCLVSSAVLRLNLIDQYYGYFSRAHHTFLNQLPPPPPGMMLPR